MEQSDIDYLKTVYSKARDKYKPRTVRVLVIAETPPCALDRFFYFEDVKKQDSLFLEIMAMLYPELKEQYLSSGRATELKQELLQSFQSDGYLMIDLFEIPTSISTKPLDIEIKSLLEKLERIIDKQTPIILIKTNVYDACFETLKKSGYNVINERLPFPGSGQQRVFREKFKRALQKCE